ncbi:tripartite tricarboxylate transporter substrate binding protein [Roseinatronobacter sp. S2]|uniref:Bug family tripartite tricarboxylate transporter substrate binding protein n=1 Tax=Roseinatronobacter sp. S2 TaxID=3035471 RepID=UPI0024100C86|nr:tripartite tricarboxylate transporter substrate binding protein [Roseinatronobacter sp. S2]WFE76712.1 tripartite tricarboxylate transporter substrate binding protein [Roseinatronobacter sp. S2]
MSKKLLGGIGIAAITLMGSMAFAQDYPTQTVRLIVPYAPGGQGDITARLLADRLTPRLGQTVIVENRPGANGVLGTDVVVKADPDGHTLGLVVASHVLQRGLMSDLPYDPIEDVAPVTLTTRTEMVLTATTTLPVNTLPEFVEYARERPGQLAYKSAGQGSNTHLFGAWFTEAAGLDMIHIPYSGSGASHPDIIAGVVHLGFDTVPSAGGLIDDEQLNLLAAAGSERMNRWPDVPTIAEAGADHGLAEFSAGSWAAVIAPAGTPDDILNMLYEEIAGILEEPEVIERFSSMGAVVAANTPEETAAIFREEEALYTDLIKRLDINLE